MSQDYSAKSPYCGHDLDPSKAKNGFVTCECGRKTDVRWVRELGWLEARSLWVKERIINGDAWFDSRLQSAPTATDQQRGSGASAGQRILYVLGGLSLIVAAVVFTAVAWERIGPIGQMLALLFVTSVSSFIAIKSRTTLIGLANTSAIVASAVVMTGFIAAPSFGLFPESWSDDGSYYPALVIYTVGGLSLLAGLKTQIQSWMAVAPLSLVVGTIAIVEGAFQYHLQDDQFIMASYLTYTIVVMAFGQLLAKFSVAGFSALKVTTLVAVFIMLVLSLSRIFGLFAIHNMPIVLGIFLLVLSVAWMAYFLLLASRHFDATPIFNLVAIASPYLAAAVFGSAFSVLLSPSRNAVDSNVDFNVTFVALAIIGSVIALLPVIMRNFPKSLQTLPIVAAGALWVSTLAIGSLANDEIYLSTVGQVKLSEYTFFFLWLMMSTSLSILWWQSNSLGHFIPAIITGSISLLVLVNSIAGESISGPEPITLPIALYVLLTLLVRQSKSEKHIKSAITLGIPFSIGYIPSALVSVVILDSSETVGTMDWLRLWIVLLVGITAIIVGAKRHLAGLLYPGTVGFSMAVLPQVFVNLSLYVPRWIIFLVIGIVLILVAVRFESLKSFRELSRSWFKSLR
jgi:hypothetical protein